ncbi:Arabidopsis Toxicos en Levadura 52 [Hibiscus trionum]|uniref:Arabidopsis Toxicos en Levadura 52 n=1 Tax=Hibiscus trionum TaxID=183268 RepID=A0A9W7M435_HIBTR|nr:Arabidopsis Toxicos en Levadura 52 [Hibiscus trionum]
MEDGKHDGFGDSRLSIILAGMGSAALVVTIYHCIATGWWHRYYNNLRGQTSQQAQQDQQRRQHAFGHETLEITSLENSTAELIVAHKYRKGTGLVDDDGMCAVCLSQFEEDEAVKTLPGCSHSYHAPCIDMWLYSHSSCPMCRTDATPSPQISQHLSDSGSVRLDTGMLHNIIESRIS